MNYNLARKRLALATATAVMALGYSTFAGAEVPSWCGPKQASLALLDGYGGNSWRQVTTASGKMEAEKCPSITRYEYADGQGDTQKSISDIKSMAAKGIDALVVFGDAGPAVLPAARPARTTPSSLVRRSWKTASTGATGSRACCPMAETCCSSAVLQATARDSTSSRA